MNCTMIKFYFVFLIYLQITHQSSHLHQLEDSSSVFLEKLFYQRNRRQLLDRPDSDAIVFRDDEDDDKREFDNRRNLPIPLPPQNKRPSWLDIGVNPTTIKSLTTTPLSIPGMETAIPRCEIACRTTPEYNPVCGNDNMTYFSIYRLKCAQKCGKRVQLKHLGACTRRRWDNVRNNW